MILTSVGLVEKLGNTWTSAITNYNSLFETLIVLQKIQRPNNLLCDICNERIH